MSVTVFIKPVTDTSNKQVVMKMILKILAAFSIIIMLSSCGTSRKAERNQNKETVVQQDTLPPTHPPVVVPHTWREAM